MPSEYMIEMMTEKDLLLPIDHSQIPNIKNIDPYFLDLPFDPENKYSIPYFWGTLGIAFNPELLDGQTFESWDRFMGSFAQARSCSSRQCTRSDWHGIEFIRVFIELNHISTNCVKRPIN